MWHFTGTQRPDFAEAPATGQESVWDYPRPPKLDQDARQVIVRVGHRVIADTRHAIRVLETASPPTFYLPPDDIDLSLLIAAAGDSRCEWKGRAQYWSVRTSGDNDPALESVGWSYPHPKPASRRSPAGSRSIQVGSPARSLASGCARNRADSTAGG